MKVMKDIDIDAFHAALNPDELEEIRREIQQGIASIEAGNYTVHVGRRGLRTLVSEIKMQGRARLGKSSQ